jgi:hypothetical protein
MARRVAAGMYECTNVKGVVDEHSARDILTAALSEDKIRTTIVRRCCHSDKENFKSIDLKRKRVAG